MRYISTRGNAPTLSFKDAREHADPDVPMVTLSTAHPAKFPDTVHDATGKISHPPVWGDIPAERSETVAHLMNDRACVEAHILEHFFRAQKLINSTAKD
jgi:threonine synthase